MLRLAIFIQPGRIGSKKSKWEFVIFVLNQVEIDATGQVNVGAVLFDKLLDRARIGRNFSGKSLMQGFP